MTHDAPAPPAARTSLTHPILIAEIEHPSGGLIGLSFCPGKQQADAMTGAWHRQLDLDLDAVAAWGAEEVVGMAEAWELDRYGVAALPSEVRARGMGWSHAPFVDDGVPDGDWEAAWHERLAPAAGALERGGRAFVFCKGGLGRSGLVACRLLVESGVGSREALDRVRAARPGAVCTVGQEAYVLALRAAQGIRGLGR